MEEQVKVHVDTQSYLRDGALSLTKISKDSS